MAHRGQEEALRLVGCIGLLSRMRQLDVCLEQLVVGGEDVLRVLFGDARPEVGEQGHDGEQDDQRRHLHRIDHRDVHPHRAGTHEREQIHVHDVPLANMKVRDREAEDVEQLSFVYYAQGRYDEAESLLVSLLTSEPENKKYLDQLKTVRSANTQPKDID